MKSKTSCDTILHSTFQLYNIFDRLLNPDVLYSVWEILFNTKEIYIRETGHSPTLPLFYCQHIEKIHKKQILFAHSLRITYKMKVIIIIIINAISEVKQEFYGFTKRTRAKKATLSKNCNWNLQLCSFNYWLHQFMEICHLHESLFFEYIKITIKQ